MKRAIDCSKLFSLLLKSRKLFSRLHLKAFYHSSTIKISSAIVEPLSISIISQFIANFSSWTFMKNKFIFLSADVNLVNSNSAKLFNLTHSNYLLRLICIVLLYICNEMSVNYKNTQFYWYVQVKLNKLWVKVNPLSADPTKWSNTLKQFVGNSQQIVWMCLTILWNWRLKG